MISISEGELISTSVGSLLCTNKRSITSLGQLNYFVFWEKLRQTLISERISDPSDCLITSFKLAFHGPVALISHRLQIFAGGCTHFHFLTFPYPPVLVVTSQTLGHLTPRRFTRFTVCSIRRPGLWAPHRATKTKDIYHFWGSHGLRDSSWLMQGFFDLLPKST